MMYRIIFVTLISAFLFPACKTKPPTRPKEYYDKVEEQIQISTLNLPIRISKSELERNVNNQLGEVLFEDNEMKGDGLKIRATKQDKITLEVKGKQVIYRVPIDLWVQKDLAITTVEGEGALAVELSTDFDIKPNWDFETTTKLVSYQWTKTPIVRTPLGNLNVTGIADEFIDQFKSEITSNIDAQLHELLDLKKEIGKAWKQLQKPFLVSEEYDTYLLVNPTQIGMTPLSTTDNTIQSTVVISALPKLFFGKSPTSINTSQLPDFQFTEVDNQDDFKILMSSSVSFKEAEKVAQANMVGETYDVGKKTVKVEEVELFGQGNKLVVKTNLSGGYEGDVYLIGKPEYNSRKNRIELENVEFDFSSKKTLLRTAAWLFKGTFKRKVQDELDFYLTQNLKDTQSILQKELERFELSPGIELKGELNDLIVSKVFIGADAIHVKVGMDGKLNLEVNGFGE